MKSSLSHCLNIKHYMIGWYTTRPDDEPLLGALNGQLRNKMLFINKKVQTTNTEEKVISLKTIT